MLNKLIFFTALLFLLSCREVIQLELESSEQRLVVEAYLDASAGQCVAKLRKSSDFYAEGNFESLDNASVSLQSAEGEKLLMPTAEGFYALNEVHFAPSDSVELHIKLADGSAVISDVVVVPPAVRLDSLGLTQNPGSGNTANYTLTAYWKDFPGMANYYRLKIYRNGFFQSQTYILADDRLGDGLPVARPVIRQRFERGDTLRCQLLTVSKAYYDYFTELANGESRGFSNPAPFNPKGNLSADALGYFGAWYSDEKIIVVK